MQNQRDDVARRFPFKRHTTGDHFVEHDTKAPDVGAGIDLQAACLLWRHVIRRAHDDAWISLHVHSGGRLRVGSDCRSFGEFSQPEVQNLRIPIAPEHDVLGFDVTMYDAGFVRGGEPAGHLTGDID